MKRTSKAYVVNKGIPTSSLRQLTIIVAAVAGNLTEFASQITGIPFSGVQLMVLVDRLVVELGKSRMRDVSATDEAFIISQLIRANYATDAIFVEDLINTTNDPSLAAKLGFLLRKGKGKINILPITVTNSSMLGRVDVILARISGAHSYIIEYTQIEEDGTIIKTDRKTLGLTRGSIDGLVSGAKYMFRMQPVGQTPDEGPWTDYVILRIS